MTERHTFNVGDTVRCVQTDGDKLIEGRCYTVTAVGRFRSESSDHRLELDGLGSCGFRASRFEPVATPQADAAEGCAACGSPADPGCERGVGPHEGSPLCGDCACRDCQDLDSAIRARRSQPKPAPKAEPIGCEHGLGFACGCKPMPPIAEPAPVQKRDPYAEHREKLRQLFGTEDDWEGVYCTDDATAYQMSQSVKNEAARKRNIAALAAELRRPVGPRFPAEGRSDRALPVTNGRKW